MKKKEAAAKPAAKKVTAKTAVKNAVEAAIKKGSPVVEEIPAKPVMEIVASSAPEPEPLPALPDLKKLSATGPNSKFPYGVQITQGGKRAYERFATREARDLRIASLGKREEVKPIDHEAAAKAPDAPKAPGPSLVPKPPKKEPGANKRITDGAEVKEWRAVKSLRVGQPGYFAQGGHYLKEKGQNKFIVGEEKHFDSLRAAQEFCDAKLPKKAV